MTAELQARRQGRAPRAGSSRQDKAPAKGLRSRADEWLGLGKGDARSGI